MAVLLWLNHALYGSVSASGYGDATQLFSAGAHQRQPHEFRARAVPDAEPRAAAGLLAPVVFDGDKRRAVGGAAGLPRSSCVRSTCCISRIPEWWYLRFLIPALVLLLILRARSACSWPARARMGGVIPIVAVLLGILGTRAAGERQAFDLQRLEGRYRDTAALVARSAAGERRADHRVAERQRALSCRPRSGDVGFARSGVARSRGRLADARGRQPYLLFERREEPEFRARFRGQSALGALDWPPRFDLNRQVRIYDPADRARFLAGETYPTENQPRRK